MNEKGAGRPHLGLLLLIPAAMILAKGARHRRAMWESEWGPGPGAADHGHGRHAGLGPREPGSEGRGAFQLPPKIERVLDAWHARAHETEAPPEPTTA